MARGLTGHAKFDYRLADLCRPERGRLLAVFQGRRRPLLLAPARRDFRFANTRS